MIFVVIPSEARNLLSMKTKQIPQPDKNVGLRNDIPRGVFNKLVE